MTDETEKSSDNAAQQTSSAMAPKSKRDALREKLKKAASNAGPPTDDWGTAELPDDVQRK
jgi:hypothetical protein